MRPLGWMCAISIGNTMICSDIGCKYHSDISKLLHVISRADRRVKCETILNQQKVCNFHM